MALITAALFLGFLPTAHAQIYVDADNTSGIRDGTSWATAYSSFRTALLNAKEDDAIWVADGTYPTGDTRDNSFTFTGAKDGLKIYGGFQGQSRPGGGETTLDQRDPDAYEAVLTGDVDGDGTLGGNAYHVFVLDGTNDPITPTTVIDGVTITGGNASGNSFPLNAGGGLLCRGEGGLCNPTIVGVTFRGNRAGFGGAMFNEGEHGGQSRPMIVNSVFVGNEATSNGGAMLNSGKGTNGQGSPVIINTTFTGNTAGGNGGAMINNGLNGGRAEPQLTNVILWNNDATDGAELYNLDATPTLTHTLVEGGLQGNGISNNNGSSLQDGGGNLNADPDFVDADGPDDTFGTADDDVRALRTSPVLDAGTNVPFETVAQTIETDVAGNDRIQDDDGDGTATVDLGAFEGGEPRIWYVDADATGATDGSSWTDAFRDLQNAFAAAQAGDEIWVAEGTYYPDEGQNVDEDDRTESFLIPGEKDGLQIYGGFAGDETQRFQRDPSQHRSILSGDISTTGDPNDRSRHVVWLDGTSNDPITRATVIDGVTITEGNASGSPGSSDTAGGGLYCNGSGNNVTCSPTLSNIIFRNNRAFYGGAIYNGGYDEGTSNPLIVNAVFIDNQAARGGAICNDGSKDAITGGESGSAGGTSSPTLVNVTVANNTAGNYAGAMYSYGGDNGTSQPTLANAILWNNTADQSGDQLFNSNATPTLTHTLIEGGLSGDGIANDDGGSLQDGGGNFDADPLFVDVNGADNDVRLFVGSPALNAGTNDAVPADTPDLDGDGDTTEPLPIDRAGEARIQVGTVDLGAYEGGILRVREGTSGLPPVRGPADWGDVDNDGDLDLALAGGSAGNPVTALYRNGGDTDGDGRPDFTDVQAGFLKINPDGDIVWGDYDADGDLDLLVIGQQATTTGGATARIYRNEGDTNNDGTVDFTTLSASDLNLPGFRSESTAAWGDYDSDGDLDLIIGGLNPSSQRLTSIYRNDGDTDNDGIVNFIDIQADLPDLSDPSIAWGDFDEDGDLDLILQGLPDTGSPVTAIYRNDGDSDGDNLADFTDISAGLLSVEDGSVDWGDYDSDGDLDLVITGSNSSGNATRIYRNEGDIDSDGTIEFVGLAASTTGLPNVGTTGVPSSNVEKSSVGQWGDADLDGDLDLLLVGVASTGSSTFEIITRLYRNDGGDRFTQFPGILAGVIPGDGTWGDYDGDGDLDIVVTGSVSGKFLTRVIGNERFTTPRDDAATVSVVSDGRVDFGTTGLAIDFGPGTTPGSVTVSRFNTPPPDTDGLPSDENISQYRFLITTDGDALPGSGTRVRFDPDALGGITTPGNVTVYTRSALDAGTFVELPTTVENGEIAATVTGFSEFVLTSPTDPLPVELTAFDAQQQSDAVLLTWQTAAETNNAGFYVQRRVGSSTAAPGSVSKASWTELGFVEGGGTTKERQSYRFEDTDLPYEAESLTYRLRQVDLDGTASTSDPVTVNRSSLEAELLPSYPNPAQSMVTLRYAVPDRGDASGPSTVRIELYDLLGRHVKTVVNTKATGRHEQVIDVRGLASGMYFLRMQTEGFTETRRLTIVR
ncbi:FG-GAP-like repeat-containing protein [Salisaeta longa]|uniref:FG-GAP-like repeat-containing protein n=1 Tax=Salisaeta longa TaxID=503170 RepID=UPI00048D47E2|nr:FG-GAP-like repeat-containing protein [Salisaeta longa]